MFEPYLARWGLVLDGAPIVTHSSRLLPVRRDGEAAMLKIALEAEERSGADLMIWWGGEGAACVLAHDGDALLLERALGGLSLEAMARNGRDDEATRILCTAAARLHARRDRPPPELVPLTRWFAELEPAAARYGGILAKAAPRRASSLPPRRTRSCCTATSTMATCWISACAAGSSSTRSGWSASAASTFANILRNPDAQVATARGRLARQASVIAEAARLDRTRLLQWTLAFAGLSAAWIFGDGDKPTLDLAVAEIAASELA